MGDNKMTRRTALARGMALGAFGLLGGGFVSARPAAAAAHDAATSDFLTQPLRISGGSVKEIELSAEFRAMFEASQSMGVAALPWALLGREALKWLGVFAVEVGINLAAGRAADFIRTLGRNDQATMQRGIQSMTNGGFTDSRVDSVFAGQGVVIHGACSKDGTNACSPIYVVNRDRSLAPPFMIHGPIMLALAGAAQEWNVRGISASDGLTPLCTVPSDNSAFTRPTQGVAMQTRAGSMTVRYEPTPRGSGGTARQTGGVSGITVTNSKNKVIFEDTFTAQWA